MSDQIGVVDVGVGRQQGGCQFLNLFYDFGDICVHGVMVVIDFVGEFNQDILLIVGISGHGWIVDRGGADGIGIGGS